MSPPCRKCQKTESVICYPQDHSQTICPDCCDDVEHADGESGHQFDYERSERQFICRYCGIPKNCTKYSYED